MGLPLSSPPPPPSKDIGGVTVATISLSVSKSLGLYNGPCRPAGVTLYNRRHRLTNPTSPPAASRARSLIVAGSSAGNSSVCTRNQQPRRRRSGSVNAGTGRRRGLSQAAARAGRRLSSVRGQLFTRWPALSTGYSRCTPSSPSSPPACSGPANDEGIS